MQNIIRHASRCVTPLSAGRPETIVTRPRRRQPAPREFRPRYSSAGDCWIRGSSCAGLYRSETARYFQWPRRSQFGTAGHEPEPMVAQISCWKHASRYRTQEFRWCRGAYTAIRRGPAWTDTRPLPQRRLYTTSIVQEPQILVQRAIGKS